MKINAFWPEPFIQQVSAAVREGGVRFLGGVFDCPSEQAAASGRSCGAVAPSPFAQIFKETIDGRPNDRFSLAFIFVRGGCQLPRTACTGTARDPSLATQ